MQKVVGQYQMSCIQSYSIDTHHEAIIIVTKIKSLTLIVILVDTNGVYMSFILLQSTWNHTEIHTLLRFLSDREDPVERELSLLSVCADFVPIWQEPSASSRILQGRVTVDVERGILGTIRENNGTVVLDTL